MKEGLKMGPDSQAPLCSIIVVVATTKASVKWVMASIAMSVIEGSIFQPTMPPYATICHLEGRPAGRRSFSSKLRPRPRPQDVASRNGSRGWNDGLATWHHAAIGCESTGLVFQIWITKKSGPETSQKLLVVIYIYMLLGNGSHVDSLCPQFSGNALRDGMPWCRDRVMDRGLPSMRTELQLLDIVIQCYTYIYVINIYSWLIDLCMYHCIPVC